MQINNAFLGSRIRKTGVILSTQVLKILKEHMPEAEPRAIPILNVLNNKGSSSISEIADSVGFTHPAVIQLVNRLGKDKIIKINKSKFDKRLTILELTPKGKDIFKNIEPVLLDIDEVIESMLSDIDVNLPYLLSKLEKAVKEGLLLKKVDDRTKQKSMNEVLIIPYKKKYKSDFKRLNVEWLKKYFTVEDKDKRQLSNPEKEIINKGGEVFFALFDKEVVGTCAMLKVDDLVFELAKMAVTEKVQGKRIGKKLMLTCIGYAVEEGAKKIILYTSPKLTTAINLYLSVGFKRTEKKNTSSVYKRKVFTMELDLTTD